MLTDGIASAYREGATASPAQRGRRGAADLDLRRAATPTPYLFEDRRATWLADHALGEEVFGPLGLVVRVAGRRARCATIAARARRAS